MFNAVLSDDGKYVLMYHEGKDEPEVMETFEFTKFFGSDILSDESAQDKVAQLDNLEAHVDDVEQYWIAFRRLVKLCGQYAHRAKLRRNAADGTLKAQMVAYDYFGPDADNKLAVTVAALDHLRHTAVYNLDYWSRRVGYKRMSTPRDVKVLRLKRRADTEILLDHLSKPDFRKRIYRRIDKYAKKGESKSPAEIVTEILLSYQKKSRQPS